MNQDTRSHQSLYCEWLPAPAQSTWIQVLSGPLVWFYWSYNSAHSTLCIEKIEKNLLNMKQNIFHLRIKVHLFVTFFLFQTKLSTKINKFMFGILLFCNKASWQEHLPDTWLSAPDNHTCVNKRKISFLAEKIWHIFQDLLPRSIVATKKSSIKHKFTNFFCCICASCSTHKPLKVFFNCAKKSKAYIYNHVFIWLLSTKQYQTWRH